MGNPENKPRIRIARNAAKKLLNEIAINSAPIVINDVIKHLRRTCDLTVVPWDFGNNTSGIQTSDENSITIGYNKNQHPHRQRFTVAHEIGHFILGHTDIQYSYCDLNSSKPEEIEANQFAAELLMPLQFLKEDISKGIKDVPLFSRKYNVSEEMVWWRLMDCKLIGKM